MDVFDLEPFGRYGNIGFVKFSKIIKSEESSGNIYCIELYLQDTILQLTAVVVTNCDQATR